MPAPTALLRAIGKQPDGDQQLRFPPNFGGGAGVVSNWDDHTAESFRVDYDPDKGIHYNWFDWTHGNKGAGGRWGAEVFPGSREQYVALLRALQK